MDERVLSKIKNLILEGERIDHELEALIGVGEPPKRGRPRKDCTGYSTVSGSTTTTSTGETDSRSEGQIEL
jgi:hypothetical protein